MQSPNSSVTRQQYSRKTIPTNKKAATSQISKAEKKRVKRDEEHFKHVEKMFEGVKIPQRFVMQWKYLLDDKCGGADYAQRFKNAFPDAEKSPCGNYYLLTDDEGNTHGFPMYLFEESPGEPQHLPTNLMFQKLPSLVFNPVRRWFVKRTRELQGFMNFFVHFDPQYQLVEKASDFSKYITVGPTHLPEVEDQKIVEGFVNLYINRKQTAQPSSGSRYMPEPLIISMLDVDLINVTKTKVQESKYGGKQTCAIPVGGWEYQLKEPVELLGEFVENRFRWLYRDRKDVRPTIQKYLYNYDINWDKEGEEFANDMKYKACSPFLYVKFGTKITYAIHGQLQEGFLTQQLYNKLIENECQADMTFKVQVTGKFDEEEKLIPCETDYDRLQSNSTMYNQLTKRDDPMIKARELKMWLQFHIQHVNFHPQYVKKLENN